MLCFFAVWAGACFFFFFFFFFYFNAVWAGGRAYCFCCLGRVRVFFAVCAWVVCVFFIFFIFFVDVWAVAFLFLLFGRWACLFFLLFGRGACFFLLFGRGACFFVVCCLGGEREFTHLPVCLARLQATQQQKRPNSKTKKNTGSLTTHRYRNVKAPQAPSKSISVNP